MPTIKVLDKNGVDVLGILPDIIGLFPVGGFPKPKHLDDGGLLYKLQNGYSAVVEGSFDKAGVKGTIDTITLVQGGQEILELSDIDRTLQSLDKLNDAGAELLLTTILSKNITFIGGRGDDAAFSFGGGNFTGGSGDDVFQARGKATYNGGIGSDTVTYAFAKADVVASLSNAKMNQGEATGDLYIKIENLVGGGGDDTLYGNRFANILIGGEGKDVLVGGAGADKLRGEGGFDWASYQDVKAAVDGIGVVASLADPTGNKNFAKGDTYQSIEGLIGTAFNDTLIGDDGDNMFIGDAGNDYIRGGKGADQIWGGSIVGGTVGFDSFVYTAIDEGGDKIWGFSEDFILISRSGFGLAANYQAVAGQNFIVAAGATAQTDQKTFLFDTTTRKLLFDADGSGADEAELIAEINFTNEASVLEIGSMVFL